MPAPILTVDATVPEPERIEAVAAVLRRGGAVILPTDTVYGVALLVSPATSPQRLLEIKQRSEKKSIPLLVARVADLKRYGTCLPRYAFELAAAHWPGALTLVVQASGALPPQFVSADGSVALRMPAHAVSLALLEACGAPLACSSANLSGAVPAIEVALLSPELSAQVSLILDGGAIAGGTASTVISCLASEPKVLRPGPVVI